MDPHLLLLAKLKHAYESDMDSLDIQEDELTSFVNKTETLRGLCDSLNAAYGTPWIRHVYWPMEGSVVFFRECHHGKTQIRTGCHVGVCGCTCNTCRIMAQEHRTAVQEYRDALEWFA